MQPQVDNDLKHKPLCAKKTYDDLCNKEIKVIIVGDGYTGKSALIEQLIKQDFSWKYTSTVSFLCIATYSCSYSYVVY